MKRILLSFINLMLIATLTFAQNECNLPVITSTTGEGTYCLGEEVTLTVTGELNDATEWQWSTGECGDQIIADSNTASITVTVEDTVFYYVRGIGGCVENTAECTEIKVFLDNDPPTVTCPENIVVSNDDGLCSAVVTYDLPTAADNCDEEVTVEQTEGLGSGEVFPVGMTTEKYVFTDTQGNTTECAFTITVEDNQAPVIICAADIEAENDPGECGAIVTYAAPTATDNCAVESIKLTEGLGSGSFFPVGTTIETFTATDASGNSSTCEMKITVIDTELPVITLSKNLKTKWPPNHKPFELNIDEYIESVTDNCPGVSIEDVIIDKVSSDEENNEKGDGNTTDDIVIDADCKTVHLLAERQGGGNGRVYTINLAVADAHGNIGVAEIKAEISHDQSKKKTVIDDGPVYIVNGCDIVEDDNTENPETQPSTEVPLELTESSGSDNNFSLTTYPNPFNHEFKFTFIPREDDFIEISLYTVSGKKVKNLFRGAVKAKQVYTDDFDADGLDEALFLVVIKGNKTHAVKKVMRR